MALSGQLIFNPPTPINWYDQLRKKLQVSPSSIGQAVDRTNQIPIRSPQQQAHDEVLKEDAKTEEQSQNRIDTLLNTAGDVIYNTTTVFPFTLLPNKIIIDINKVDFVFQTFIGSAHIHSVMIKDITDVVVETGFFFARIKLIDSGFTEGTIIVDYLPKDGATIARRIIQGLVIANQQKLDLTKISPEEIRMKLEELGRVKQVE